ncbi:LacI family DNA-binding transcriptional regulator [Rhizomonospora bruguierae]|uniref:LacI family DNA-binding transcriptional regulator n=1 Tax=Rhizomonospora bruguierae TaxID=1581705 RepID=UPI001BD03410|nr:LacI family DNA-binding transcriptional regulator [Micromonospora sp. NBRC 107566]
MRPTLQTVADAVGVSRSTVSNAYSRPDQLSPELRDRILSTAARLGYSGPDPTARSLRRGRVGSIGVLFTGQLTYAFTDPFAIQFLIGLAEAAEHHNTGLLLLPLSEDDEEAAARSVREALVDGFCVYCVPSDWYRSLAQINPRGLPVVGAELRDREAGAMFVGIDEAAATRAAGEHLIRLGHRRLAVIIDRGTPGRGTGPLRVDDFDTLPHYVARERLRGYRDAFTAAGVDWPTVTVVNAAANTRAEGAAAAAHVLDRADRPTAVFAITDLLAFGVLDALRARGLRAGRDVSVIGFDDIPDAATARLTTVRQPAVERGRAAGVLLLDPPPEAADRQVVLPTELIVRASTGPAPTATPTERN